MTDSVIIDCYTIYLVKLQSMLYGLPIKPIWYALLHDIIQHIPPIHPIPALIESPFL